MKRLFDLFLTTPRLIMILPVIIIVAIFIRIRLRSPVLFAQVRPGQDGQFTIVTTS